MFRSEVHEHRKNALYGDVHLINPLSWQVITYAMIAMLVISMIFFATATYSRVENVPGSIVPHSGLAAILPTRPGTITALPIADGQNVDAGDVLAEVRVEETGPGGRAGPAQVLDALKEQDARLAAQERATLVAGNDQRLQLQEQLIGSRSELRALDNQIEAQRRLVGNAVSDVDGARDVATRGFISKRDMKAREDTLAVRQQQLAALEQARSDKVAQIAGAASAIHEVIRRAESGAAGIAGTRAEVAQRRYDVEASRGYRLTAPIDGMVTALTARIGQAAQTTTPLMTIIPRSARFEARLLVPTQAIGFLSPGQKVRLQIDAFPYDRFGTVDAIISRLSAATIEHLDENGRQYPVYMVTASISRPGIFAFGRWHRLQAGMTVRARIVTAKRTLLEWLFEPLLALRQR